MVTAMRELCRFAQRLKKNQPFKGDLSVPQQVMHANVVAPNHEFAQVTPGITCEANRC